MWFRVYSSLLDLSTSATANPQIYLVILHLHMHVLVYFPGRQVQHPFVITASVPNP